MAFLKRRLIDADARRQFQLAAREPASHGAVHDSVDLISAQVHHLRDTREARPPQPVDHQCLEEKREATAGCSPRYLDLDDPAGVARVIGGASAELDDGWVNFR